MSGISLTASMRSNLLSLQGTSKLMDLTQQRLSTGKKVNSAIDNPSNFYTAQSLNNRAKDLDALLDSMGQAVATIKAATTCLENSSNFLEQATAVATQALENAIPAKEYFEQQDNVVAVVSNWNELKAAVDSGQAGDIVIYGNIACEDKITLKDGQNLVGVGYYGVKEPDVDKFSNLSFDGFTTSAILLRDNALISDLSFKFTNNKNNYDGGL